MEGVETQREENGDGQNQPQGKTTTENVAEKVRMLYKEYLAKVSPAQQEREEIVSDDEDVEAEDDLECLEVRLSKEDNVRLRRLWRRLLIINVLGQKVGYTYLSK